MTKKFETSIDINSESREQLVSLLNQQLADTFDLYSQTKQAHWNVKGPHFIQLHELYDKLAAELTDHVDTIAERATALGGVALGTARLASAASRLPEFPASGIGSLESVRALVDRFAAVGTSTRAAIDAADDLDDADTADVFTEVSRSIDKALWFLEAHLQK